MPIISLSEDGERTPRPNNGTLTQSLRLSDLNNGRIMPWKFKVMEEVQISEQHQPSTHDGGKCSECRDLSSPMNMARLLMYLVDLIQKTETLLFGKSTERSTNNGT